MWKDYFRKIVNSSKVDVAVKSCMVEAILVTHLLIMKC